MVCQISSEAFAPIAQRGIDVDAVAPPVVDDFVGVGVVDDEGQADDLRAEQGEGGHAVTGFPEVFHQGELGVGIRPEQVGIEGEVALGGGQITFGQMGVRRAQINHGRGFRAALIAGEAARNEVDVLLGCVLAPAHPAAIFGAAALAHRFPSRRQAGRQREGVPRVGGKARIPTARGAQHDALRGDETGRDLSVVAGAFPIGG